MRKMNSPVVPSAIITNGLALISSTCLFIYSGPSTRKVLSCSCCDMGQNDTIGKIELKPSIVLSSDNTDCKNDIQLFHQLFDELSVHTDYH